MFAACGLWTSCTIITRYGGSLGTQQCALAALVSGRKCFPEGAIRVELLEKGSAASAGYLSFCAWNDAVL